MAEVLHSYFRIHTFDSPYVAGSLKKNIHDPNRDKKGNIDSFNVELTRSMSGHL